MQEVLMDDIENAAIRDITEVMDEEASNTPDRIDDCGEV